MKSLLISTLETICPNNVYLQGTFSQGTYPESFITFWTNDASDDVFYDDSEHAYIWNFSVIFYSSDPALVASQPPLIRSALKAAGFIPQGKGMDIPSDEISHTGWAMEFLYKEQKQN